MATAWHLITDSEDDSHCYQTSQNRYRALCACYRLGVYTQPLQDPSPILLPFTRPRSCSSHAGRFQRTKQRRPSAEVLPGAEYDELIAQKKSRLPASSCGQRFYNLVTVSTAAVTATTTTAAAVTTAATTTTGAFFAGSCFVDSQ